MASPPPAPPRPDGEQMPGWVKGFLVVAVAIVVLVVAVVVAGSGDHGPARHIPGGGPTHMPDGHTPPFDH